MLGRLFPLGELVLYIALTSPIHRLADQQIGGFIMKIPGASTFMVILIMVFFAWYNSEERGGSKKGEEKRPEEPWPDATSAPGR